MMRTILIASLSLVAAACGKVQSLADANGSGSNIDANTGPDANPRGTVKVTVFDPSGTGANPTGIPVVFIDPNGSLVANVPTDSNGKAQADVLPGASVTAVFAPDATDYVMDVVLGVKPGDDIVIQDTPSQATTGTFTVSFPSLANATTYYAYGPCGGSPSSTGGPAALTFQAYCTVSPMTVGVVAYNSSGQVIGYIEQANLTFTDGGSTTIPGSWGNQISMTASATNVPADVTNVAFYRTVRYPSGFGTSMGSAAPSNSMVTISSAVPASNKAVMQTTLRKNATMQFIYQPVDGGSTSYSVDAGANELPWLAQPSMDVTTATITNNVSGPAPPSGFIYYVGDGYQRSVGGTATNYRWTIVTGSTDPITLPKMPAAVGDVNPKPGDTVSLFNGVAFLLASDAIPDWDHARNHAFEAVEDTLSRSPMPPGANVVRLSRTPFIAVTN